jgi:putative tryptophan/tyrosine transport system substrate-binding protein
MRRRDLITLLGGAAVAWPLAARAQQRAMPVFGALFAVSAPEWEDFMAGFRRGLSESGFVEGQNVAIEYRWADGHFDSLPTMAADLVRRKVALIFTGGTVGVRAAMAATQTIPIVFTIGVDPIAAGFVASLNRPGGNVTGVTLISSELAPKRLELLRELVTTATKIALLVNPNNPASLKQETQGVEEAARRLGKEIIVVGAGTENELEGAFAAAVQRGAAAFLVESDPIFVSSRLQIAALALRHSLPLISNDRQIVAAGGLMSYGTSIVDTFRQAGTYVARILKGEKPADMPVMQPTKFEFVMNLKTAKTLGLTVPPTLLAIADEVIE